MGGARDEIMNVLEQKQWDEFLEKGLPTRKDERWKYTDLTCVSQKRWVAGNRLDAGYLRETVDQYRLTDTDSLMLVIVNGYFIPALSDLNKLPEGMVALSLNDALKDNPALVKAHWLGQIDPKKYPFARANTTLFKDGLFLIVPDNCKLNMPLHVLSIAADDNEFIAHPHHLFVFGKNSQVTLFEEHVAKTKKSYMMNIVTGYQMSEGASLDHYKIQAESPLAIHIANTFIQQKQHSRVKTTCFSTGAQFARDDLVVKLQETGSICQAGGYYRLNTDKQYIDHHVDITHAAAHSQSEMLYKGILDNKSKAVFNGRLYVEKDAQKILAYQANHNLLLSPDAEVYSKPELEIYADDVKCKHGATTGQLDQEALFYMQARGINKEEAINILLSGFAGEILDRVLNPSIKKHILASL
jgi:Fe-S cluster assembly protein SufD